MKAVICGNGKSLYFLGRAFLARGYVVTLVTPDEKYAAQLARLLNATVVAGDASAPAIIEDAGAIEADVVIAATPHDHDNLAICQIASARFGVPQVLALVNDPDNEKIFGDLGTPAVSATRIMIDMVERRAAFGEISALLPLGEGRLTLAEVELGPAAPVIEKRVMDIDLPPDPLLVSVLRGKTNIIPHGQTVLQRGDRVIVITSPESHGPALRTLTGEA
ncbi:MAG TPA: TrkA family potassium uptake protein [Candidatus Hydrogenedentes bacterium]|nr:TrkA family potassium uptake protein [Candidatus Hydrogenedentota bacterium]